MIGARTTRDTPLGPPNAVLASALEEGPQWESLLRGLVAFVSTGDGSFALRPTRGPERRSLSGREARVLRACCLGLPNKVIAHNLGIDAASVSTALASAARKLGAPSGRVLVRLVSPLLPCACPVGLEGLTAAEHEVAELVGRGLSNVGIAEVRGCSVSTVANQIGSIFRKTGLGSRRALTVVLGRGAAGKSTVAGARPGTRRQ